MNQKKFKQVRQNYDRLSSFYDFLSGRAESAIFRESIKFLEKRKIEILLDIGCGTGTSLIKYRNTFQNAFLLAGIDLSIGMCRKALGHNDCISCANGIELPFSAGLFDAVCFNFSLEIFSEDCIKRVLSECMRVLKPDGAICVICMESISGKNVMYGLYSWAHDKFPTIVDCRPISVIPLLIESGFSIIEKESHNLMGLPVEIVLADKTIRRKK